MLNDAGNIIYTVHIYISLVNCWIPYWPTICQYVVNI